MIVDEKANLSDLKMIKFSREYERNFTDFESIFSSTKLMLENQHKLNVFYKGTTT